MDGMAEGSVFVTIEPDNGSFKVLSTGEYEKTRRRIEVTFSVVRQQARAPGLARTLRVGQNPSIDVSSHRRRYSCPYPRLLRC